MVLKNNYFTRFRLPLITAAMLVLVACGKEKGSPDEPEPPQPPVNPPVEKPVIPATQNAVYEGIDGYGVTDTSDKKASFKFRFTTDSGKMSFLIGTDNEKYTLQNILQEGGRFTITADTTRTTLTAVVPMVPVASGKVTSSTAGTITVDGKTYPLAANVVFTNINCRPGGCSVSPLTQVADGSSVKLYGNPVKYVDRTFIPQPYEPAIKGTPGKRTLKNFLQTAMMPVGTTLYVFGGGWNWQDDGTGPQSATIGLPQEWVSFFQMNDDSYEYKVSDFSQSYYPHHSYNEYHYAGADCSGYVGWALYNVTRTESGKDGYVMSSTKMARNLAEERGMGTISRDVAKTDFRPGDIISISGHIYICLGRAEDNSIVILHSTVNGSKGTGVQLSAINDKTDCKALQLAQTYMAKYFPQWSQRYDAVCRDLTSYTNFSNSACGRFSWYLDSRGLEDPDGYSKMTAEQILANLFGEK